ncbi:MAG: bacillithiol system redox-active protein YtxJ [Vicinamibacteraceae bacterium]|nr:bacillithiol system redox-active protein YtxJ [Vicinamibacteraceae bacterium]
MSSGVDLLPLNSTEEFEALLLASRTSPVLLYKHSLTCDVSVRAINAVHAFLGTCQGPLLARMVTVQTERPVANTIARRLNLRHESPQAILVSDGEVVWHATHFRITVDALRTALAQVAPQAAATVSP